MTTGSQMHSQLARELADKITAPRPTLLEWQMPVVSYSVLDTVGYVWHPGLKLLFCLRCHTGVMPSNLKTHSHRTENHDFAQKHVVAFVADLATGCEFGEKGGRLPDVGPFDKLPALPHLAQCEAYQCGGCGKLYKNKESLKRSCRKECDKGEKEILESVQCQYLFKGRSPVLFVIEEPLAENEVDPANACAMLAQRLQLQLAKALEESGRADWDAKDAWPYLKEVPWHLVITANQDEFDVDEMRAMVYIPSVHTKAARGTVATKLAALVEKAILGMETDVRQADYRLKQLLGAESDRYVRPDCDRGWS